MKIGRDLTVLIALGMAFVAMAAYSAIVRMTSGFSMICEMPCIEGQDLLAQQNMAAAAWWMLAATIAATLLSAGALVALILSLRQTRQAISDTREIGEYQTQAYVHATGMTGDKLNGIHLAVANTGLTPATHFAVNFTAQVVSRGSVGTQFHFRNDRFVTYSALGPGEKLTVGLAVPRSVMSAVGLAARGGEILLITGTIVYATVFNHDHETQFVFFGRPVRNALAFSRSPSNLRTFNRLGPGGLLPSQYTPTRPVVDIFDGDAA